MTTSKGRTSSNRQVSRNQLQTYMEQLLTANERNTYSESTASSREIIRRKASTMANHGRRRYSVPTDLKKRIAGESKAMSDFLKKGKS